MRCQIARVGHHQPQIVGIGAAEIAERQIARIETGVARPVRAAGEYHLGAVDQYLDAAIAGPGGCIQAWVHRPGLAAGGGRDFDLADAGGPQRVGDRGSASRGEAVIVDARRTAVRVADDWAVNRASRGRLSIKTRSASASVAAILPVSGAK